MNESMFPGVIEGGWGYVASAWGISLAMLLAYVVFTQVRYAQAKKRKEG